MDLCKYCKGEIEISWSNKEAIFCCDGCRYAYHNRLKKIKRLEILIARKTEELERLKNE